MVTRTSVLMILGRVFVQAFLVALAIVVIYPLLWMLLNGVKSNSELFADPFALPETWRWENYVTAWNRGVGDYLTTSVLVTVASTAATVLISAWAAYGLTRVKIPFNRTILILILAGLMLAPTVALIPLVKMFQALGLYNSFWALLILYTAFRVPFTTFLIRAYMLDLPQEVDEAAAVDGASKARAFWQVILPMCRPILVSAALLQALFAWNEFVFALVFISTGDLKTLPVGLMDMQSRLLTNWPVQFAGLTMAALPMLVLFLVGQRQFLRGLSDGIGK